MKRKVKKILASITLSLIMGSFISVKVHAAEKWYYAQDITAQVAPIGTPMASGEGANWTYVAVHPMTRGSTTTPILPFGAYIVTSTPIPDPWGGQNWTTFQIQDIGDIYYSRGLSLYWFDVYYGDQSNYQKAINFGKIRRDYKCIY